MAHDDYCPPCMSIILARRLILTYIQTQLMIRMTTMLMTRMSDSVCLDLGILDSELIWEEQIIAWKSSKTNLCMSVYSFFTSS